VRTDNPRRAHTHRAESTPDEIRAFFVDEHVHIALIVGAGPGRAFARTGTAQTYVD
jgi:hypothetical protein